MDSKKDRISAVGKSRSVDCDIAGRIGSGAHEPPVDQELDPRRLVEENDERSAVELILPQPGIELRSDAETGDPPLAGELVAGRPEQPGRVTLAPEIDFSHEVVDDEPQIRGDRHV